MKDKKNERGGEKRRDEGTWCEGSDCRDLEKKKSTI